MRVLYLASNSADAESLQLEREIMALQSRANQVSAAAPRFVFLPSISVEEIAREIARHRPDVLHIAAHGAREGYLRRLLVNGMTSLVARNVRRPDMADPRAPHCSRANRCAWPRWRWPTMPLGRSGRSWSVARLIARRDRWRRRPHEAGRSARTGGLRVARTM
jgi:hypothetical protein